MIYLVVQANMQGGEHMWLVDKIKIARKKKYITFENISEEWLVLKKKTVKKSTYSNYRYSINKYLLPQFKNFTIEALENYDFSEFIDDLNQDYAPKTVRDILVKLKSILYYAQDEYDSKVKIKKIVGPKLDAEPIVILSKLEKGRLEKTCLREETLKSIGVIVCLNTGLRIGEICALKWKNIDLDKREIRVKKTLQRIYDEETGKTKIIIDTPKSKKSVRNIPISNKLFEILAPLKKKYNDNDFFLTGNEKSYIEPRNYEYTFKILLKKSKVKSAYKFHITRHTFATGCIEVGMDIKSLSEILGHNSVEITLNKYVHSSYKTKKKYLEKL